LMVIHQHLLHPPAKPPLPGLCNLLDHSIRTNQLIVAYQQPNNLRNLFFTQVYQGLDNHPISTFIPRPTGCEDMIVWACQDLLASASFLIFACPSTFLALAGLILGIFRSQKLVPPDWHHQSPIQQTVGHQFSSPSRLTLLPFSHSTDKVRMKQLLQQFGVKTTPNSWQDSTIVIVLNHPRTKHGKNKKCNKRQMQQKVVYTYMTRGCILYLSLKTEHIPKVQVKLQTRGNCFWKHWQDFEACDIAKGGSSRQHKKPSIWSRTAWGIPLMVWWRQAKSDDLHKAMFCRWMAGKILQSMWGYVLPLYCR
jgi:hypothetical protein